jgi:hypothetical protein
LNSKRDIPQQLPSLAVGQRPAAVALDGQLLERFAPGIGMPGDIVWQFDRNLNGFRIAGILRCDSQFLYSFAMTGFSRV